MTEFTVSDIKENEQIIFSCPKCKKSVSESAKDFFSKVPSLVGLPEITCEQCGVRLVVEISETRGTNRHNREDKEKYSKPCPIPDEYPGTDADIAEKCRLWMVENWSPDWKKRWDSSLYRIWQDETKGAVKYENWLITYCTPANKIKAFYKVMENK
ncbi:hypothetical protein LCGC14_1083810 [marine sediment metagenome]|uniref:Uncharacterized protein n=1 Tax=marine sediment metagenome TaxID=412755 RepID=A0A0F9MEL5_9ZZZZ